MQLHIWFFFFTDSWIWQFMEYIWFSSPRFLPLSRGGHPTLLVAFGLQQFTVLQQHEKPLISWRCGPQLENAVYSGEHGTCSEWKCPALFAYSYRQQSTIPFMLVSLDLIFGELGFWEFAALGRWQYIQEDD